MALMGTLLGAFILMHGFGESSILIIPVLVVTVVWHIRSTAFCDSCGKTIHTPNGFTRAALEWGRVSEIRFCLETGERPLQSMHLHSVS